MKKILILLCLILLVGCAPEKQEEPTIKTLPKKDNPLSTRMSESPLSASNIDEYLGLENVLYFDVRDTSMVKEEGIIKGFECVPFYELLCGINSSDKLFTSKVIKDDDGNKTINLFEVGSFIDNYKESISIIEELFPKDKQLVFIASAGVESCYLMNLLIQFGWDGEKLYNAGAFSNSLGVNVAYRDLKELKNFMDGEDYNFKTFEFELTKKD